MARPTSLTEEKSRIICESLANGSTYSVAAAAAGIGERTLFTWIGRGKAKGARDPYKSFVLEVELARSIAAQVMENVVWREAKNGNADMALKWLRIRRRNEWSEDAPTNEELDADARQRAAEIADDLIRLEKEAEALRADDKMWKQAPAVTENDL